MKRITLYSYNPKNIEQIVSSMNTIGYKLNILTAQGIIEWIKGITDENPILSFDYDCYDISLVINGDSERVDQWGLSLITILSNYIKQYPDDKDEVLFIIDKKYAKDICLALPYFIKEVKSLEHVFELDDSIITNIVDIEKAKINDLKEYFSNNLFGNNKFQTRLIQELQKFRIFNALGERKIFSAFICGPSGIGKTLTAKLLHDFLSHSEKFIKINLGNYSDHNALSSLIGSPRGYVGSSKGELSSKIDDSNSKVILIDEFEKASVEVHNFFLELLSDGVFTDSQGREFDLNKYIIIFTSNLSDADFKRKISPELRSRFDLVYRMVTLSSKEKDEYLQHKINYYIEKTKNELGLDINYNDIVLSLSTDIKNQNNIRILTKDIEQAVATVISNDITTSI